MECERCKAEVLELLCKECMGNVLIGDTLTKMIVGPGSYTEYLESERWKVLAEACKSLAHYRCSLCGSSEMLNAHHRTYDNLRKKDEILDLVCLCRKCHADFHKEI